MKLSKTKLKQVIKEELEGSSRDGAIKSLKGLSNVFDKIAQADQSGAAKWPSVPGKIVSPANSSAAWMMMAEDIEDEYYDELQHAIDMLEDKEGTNPHGFRTVEHARSISHPMADELAAAMTKAVDVALPYMKSLVGSGSGITENKMKLSKAKLQQIILEEIERVEQEDLILEELSGLIDLQAKQMGIVLTEQEKKDYLQKVLKRLKKYGFGVGVGAALAGGSAGLHSMQSDYEKSIADAMAANQAVAQQVEASPEYQAQQIKKQLGNQFAFTWTVSGDPNDTTPFPAVVAGDGKWEETSIASAMKQGASPIAVLPPEWSVLKQVLDDLESGGEPRVSGEDISAPSVPVSGRKAAADSNRVEFFESDVWKTANLKSARAAPPYRGAMYVDFESLPDDYAMPLSGKTPDELYVQYWNRYVKN